MATPEPPPATRITKNTSVPTPEPPRGEGARHFIPLDDASKGGADFTLVQFRGRWRATPHCRIHGAMNKVSPMSKGGLWRCLQGKCRAGCKEFTL